MLNKFKNVNKINFEENNIIVMCEFEKLYIFCYMLNIFIDNFYVRCIVFFFIIWYIFVFK